MPPSTIIIIHRTPGRLSDCLAAVRTYTDREHRLVVVDAAGSSGRRGLDGLPADRTAALRIIAGRPGEGRVALCNRALRACESRQAIFLDSAAIVSERWLESVLDCLGCAPRAGVVGPLTAGCFTGRPASVFRSFVRSGQPPQSVSAGAQVNRHRRIAVRTPETLCLATRRTTIRALGYLDETFDSIPAALGDLCLRCELAGYRNYLAGDVFVDRATGQPVTSWKKALREKWESRDPENDLRKHYEALNLCWRANRAGHREETEQATDLFLKGIGLFPAERRLYLDLAALLVENERYQDALQTLQEMPGEGESIRAQLISGLCYKGMGAPEKAEAVAAQILNTDGQSAAGWWLQGVLLAARGDGDKAGEAFQKSITFDPGYGPGYTALGKLVSDREPGEQALDFLERGFALAPDSGEAAAAYHTAVSRVQTYRRAIPVFADAAAVCPDSRRLRYLFTDVLLKAGEAAPAMGVIESLRAGFGLEDGLLAAALAVRERLGSHEIKRAGGGGTGTLAFCMIVKDEERDLPRCLESIKPVADEIIVVDTGSRDRTRDVARAFGARVFDFAWCDDFAAAKNFAADKAKARWIFSIDADEVLSPRDHDGLRALVRGAKPGAAAYAVTTRNYLKTLDVVGWRPNDGRYPEEAGLGWMPSEKVRLFPNNRQVRFAYPVHEMVEPSLEKAGIPVLPCDIPVHHYGKLDQARSLAKGKAYFQIGKKKLEAMQASITGLRELAVQAQTLGDYEEAVRLWERVAALAPGQAPTGINLASAYLELGNYEKAHNAAEEACRLDPFMKEGHFNLAMSMFYMGDARGAAGVLEKLADRHPDYIAAGFMLAAARCCAGEVRNGTERIARLQRTRLGAGLAEALRHLADRLGEAGRERYRLRILALADQTPSGAH